MEKERLKYKLKLASSFIQEGKNLHAVQVYKSIISESEVEEPFFLLAELYETMGFVDAGKDILFDLFEFNKRNETGLFIGQYLLRNSRWKDAIEILQSLSEHNPTILFLIAYAYMMLGEFNFAKQFFINFLNSDIKGELKQEASLYLAKIEYELHNYNSALNFANDAKIIYSDFWELNLILAKVYYGLGMFTHAITPIQKALKLNPKEKQVQEFAGRIYFGLQDYIRAEKHFTELIDLSTEISSEIYTLLAKSYLNQKKMDEAKYFLEIALKIDPGYQPAIQSKIEFYR